MHPHNFDEQPCRTNEISICNSSTLLVACRWMSIAWFYWKFTSVFLWLPIRSSLPSISALVISTWKIIATKHMHTKLISRNSMHTTKHMHTTNKHSYILKNHIQKYQIWNEMPCPIVFHSEAQEQRGNKLISPSSVLNKRK